MQNRYSASTPPSNLLTAEKTNEVTTNILELLTHQADNYPYLSELVKGKNLIPSVVFLPQTLKLIDSELSLRSDLLYDCLTYLDTVKLTSFLLYKDPEVFTNQIKDIVVKNRTVISHQNCLAANAIDDFIFSKTEDGYEFLDNNKLLLSIYIFSLVANFFYEFKNA